jgi:tricorn protease
MRLFYVDLETAKQVEVAQDTYQMRTGDIAGAWSPGSKWLAYSKVLPNELSAIHLYSLAGGKSTQVTDGLSDATRSGLAADASRPSPHFNPT